MRNDTYEDNVAKWKIAYTKVLKACDKYADEFYTLYGFNDIRDMRNDANNHLMLIDWYEEYGLKLSHNHKPYSYNFFRVSDYVIFSYYGNAEQDKNNGSGRYISWSDDGRQPNNEWLLEISFSTGAYIFGDDYSGQQDLFLSLINELKSYNPDYSDTTNKSFYWKLENAKPIFDEFYTIMEKYKKLNTSELKRREVEKLRDKLKALEVEL